MDSQNSEFLYLTCKRESLPLLKGEMTRRYPDFRFSYSRPGFLTYKVPPRDSSASPRQSAMTIPSMKLTFAGAMAHSLGTVRRPSDQATDKDIMMAEFWRLVAEKGQDALLSFGSSDPQRRFSRIHVWNVETLWPNYDATAVYRSLWNAFPSGMEKMVTPPENGETILNSVANKNDFCLDCFIVSQNEWWVGFHQVSDYHSRFPGGLIPLAMAEDAASRAWLKFEEGLRWSGFPIGCGSRCVDIGASPGGGSQALLARGAEVLGVDPAEMASDLLLNPNFTHLRGRIGQIKRKLFRKSRWVIADMNVAPSYTLDVLEEMVSAPEISIRGLLFTLKLFHLNLAENIRDYIHKVKSWGFNQVRVRQLQFNRQEVMVAALKSPFHTGRH